MAIDWTKPLEVKGCCSDKVTFIQKINGGYLSTNREATRLVLFTQSNGRQFANAVAEDGWPCNIQNIPPSELVVAFVNVYPPGHFGPFGPTVTTHSTIDLANATPGKDRLGVVKISIEGEEVKMEVMKQ